jgi:hypothetical protein
MSKDDTILILTFWINPTNGTPRQIFIVTWIRAMELFNESEFVKAYMSNHGMGMSPFEYGLDNKNPGTWKYCNNFKTCLKIAKNMYYDCFRPEYGIKLIDTKLTLEELNVTFYKTKKDKFIIFK